jgi:predicted nucleic acid-binding Zn ribbon protein
MDENFETPDLSEFLASCAKQFCPWCGKPMGRNPMGRPRVFCSDRCRWAYNSWRHRKRMKEKLIHGNTNPGYTNTTGSTDLNPAAYNPRKKLKPGDKEYEKLKKSIENFGYVELIVVNIANNNTVVSEDISDLSVAEGSRLYRGSPSALLFP